MKPKIIMHTQISLDGRIKGFDNPEVYYQVAGGIHSDAVLFGSNTVFTAFEKYPAETEADFEKIITSPEDLNILDARNHNSGKLETDIPDVGNRLNSA